MGKDEWMLAFHSCTNNIHTSKPSKEILNLRRGQIRLLTGFLTGHCGLRQHRMTHIVSTLLRKRPTAEHILCEFEAQDGSRLQRDVMSISLGRLTSLLQRVRARLQRLQVARNGTNRSLGTVPKLISLRSEQKQQKMFRPPAYIWSVTVSIVLACCSLPILAVFRNPYQRLTSAVMLLASLDHLGPSFVWCKGPNRYSVVNKFKSISFC